MIEDPIFSTRRLGWSLGVRRDELRRLGANAVRLYRPFLLERPGKKPRTIDNPLPCLKNVQARILVQLLKSIDWPEFVQGGVRGRSPVTNAAVHLGKKVLVKLDIEDFFPSVTDRHVYAVWKKKLGYSPPVSKLLTPLTTFRRHLPQGAPTSTALANLVLLDVDEEICEAAYQAGCSYTRYVDDLCFSGEEPRALIGAVVRVLQKAGFTVSRRKFAVMPSHGPQEVTGLLVNSPLGPSVCRKQRDKVRAALHQCRTGKVRKDDLSRELGSIRGRIANFSKTNPGNARACLLAFDAIARGLEQG